MLKIHLLTLNFVIYLFISSFSGKLWTLMQLLPNEWKLTQQICKLFYYVSSIKQHVYGYSLWTTLIKYLISLQSMTDNYLSSGVNWLKRKDGKKMSFGIKIWLSERTTWPLMPHRPLLKSTPIVKVFYLWLLWLILLGCRIRSFLQMPSLSETSIQP